MPHSEFSSPPVSLEKLALLQNRHGDTDKAGGTSNSEAGELLLPDMLLPTHIRRGSVEQLGMPGTGEEVRPGEFARISRSSYFSSHTSLTSTASTPRSPRMRVRCQLLGPFVGGPPASPSHHACCATQPAQRSPQVSSHSVCSRLRKKSLPSPSSLPDMPRAS